MSRARVFGKGKVASSEAKDAKERRTLLIKDVHCPPFPLRGGAPKRGGMLKRPERDAHECCFVQDDTGMRSMLELKVWR